jgi:hypothetical protein
MTPYVKCVLAGVVGALLAAIVMLVLQPLLLAASMAAQTRGSTTPGSGGIGFVTMTVPGWPMAVAALAGFVLGFRWMQRRRRS